MLTLIQFVNTDSIADIYKPLIRKSPVLVVRGRFVGRTEEPLSQTEARQVFFVIFLLVVSVSIMNLVTAVIVEGAIAQAAEDKEVPAPLQGGQRARCTGPRAGE